MTKTTSAKVRAQRKAHFVELLRESRGIVTEACKNMPGGMDRITYMRWRDADPVFAKACDDIQEEVLDFAESKLLQRLEDGSVDALKYYLSCKGRKRGYGNQLDLNADMTVNRPRAVFVDTEDTGSDS